jgi:hypothetical protein
MGEREDSERKGQEDLDRFVAKTVEDIKKLPAPVPPGS